jgi:hypothetical protein
MPLPIGTLAAIHLATALIWRDRVGPLPQMMTHDGRFRGTFSKQRDDLA